MCLKNKPRYIFLRVKMLIENKIKIAAKAKRFDYYRNIKKG
jgi:hypothetical protein